MQQVMERLGLADRRNDIVETLSGGLKRRVEIAKGLLHRPVVLLMDEASTGLDPGARRELWQYVEELRSREGVTILLTTHILDEADRCDRLALLHQGSVVAEGTPAHLRSRIGGDVVVLEAAENRGRGRAGRPDRNPLRSEARGGGRRAPRGDRQRPPLHHRSGGGFSRRDRFGRVA
jgi:ABC-type multidrug transport system ATPase subunit